MPLLYYVFLGWRWTRQKYNCPVVLSPYSTQKNGLHWVPNVNEIDAINMKSTWPMPVPAVGDPPPPIFQRSGLALWVMQMLVFVLGVTQILVVFDTDMLVSPMQNCGVGCLSQSEDPTQLVLRCSGI